MVMICSLVLIDVVIGIESKKVFVLELHYETGKLDLVSKRAMFGYYPDRKVIGEGYKIEILDKNNDQLYNTNFELPILEYVEYGNSTTGEIIGEVVKYDKANFSIVVPYFDSAEKVVIYNKNGFEILEQRVNERSKIYLWYILGGIILVFLIGFLLMKKRKIGYF
jgi:hypothetical protein